MRTMGKGDKKEVAKRSEGSKLLYKPTPRQHHTAMSSQTHNYQNIGHVEDVVAVVMLTFYFFMY